MATELSKPTNSSVEKTEAAAPMPSAMMQGQQPDIPLNDRTYFKMGLWVLLLVFGLLGAWAALAPLNSATVAAGEVMVISNNRVVEHLEGGIVSEILVKEGDEVKKDQTLLKLSPIRVETELGIVTARLNEVLGQEARLKAEQVFADQVAFPELLTQNKVNPQVAEVLNGQKAVFNARKEALESELGVYQQKIEASKEQIKGLRSVVATLDERIESYKNDIQDLDTLYKEQYADKIRLHEMKRELVRLRGEKNGHLSDIAGLELSIVEIRSQSILRKQQFSEDVVSQLRDAQAEKVDLQTRKAELADRLSRTNIKAPVDGIVNGLTVYTIGEVISPGEQVMEVVPFSKDFAIKARVSPIDIDKMRVGLISDIRFSAFNTQRTHVIEGLVTHISADKFLDKASGQEYYEAKVKVTADGVKQMEEDGIFLLPGMPAEVMIKIGERTLLDYFVKPFENMFARAFNEE